MGFVKTPEEISRIEHALSHPRFVNGEMLSVDFLTDADVVAQLLPPPLEPGDSPLVSAMVGRWQSNCVGDFFGGAIYVSARHEGVDGDVRPGDVHGQRRARRSTGATSSASPRSSPTARCNRHGDVFTGHVDRGGVRIIELNAQLPTDLGAFDTESYNFNFKARPAADGIGLQEDAILTRAHFETRVCAGREGTGSVTLRGTVHDPLDELPIRSIVRASFIEVDLIGTCEAVATTPAAVFAPYHHGRHDDWSALDTESLVLAAVAG